MIRTPEQMQELMTKSLEALKAILTNQGNMRVPQTDEVIDIIFCYFISNSMSSIPEVLRMEYLEMRMMELSRKVSGSVADLVECAHCKDSSHSKTTHFNA